MTSSSKNNLLFFGLYYDKEIEILIQRQEYFISEIGIYSNPPKISSIGMIQIAYITGARTAMMPPSIQGPVHCKDGKYCTYNISGGNCKVKGRGCPSDENKANPCILTSGGPGAGVCECRDSFK